MIDWDSIYTQDSNVKSEYFNDGRLETFGKDLESVLFCLDYMPKKVWTAIEGDDGNVYYCAGFHYVNRLYYVISNEDYKSCDEVYLIT